MNTVHGDLGPHSSASLGRPRQGPCDRRLGWRPRARPGDALFRAPAIRANERCAGSNQVTSAKITFAREREASRFLISVTRMEPVVPWEGSRVSIPTSPAREGLGSPGRIVLNGSQCCQAGALRRAVGTRPCQADSDSPSIRLSESARRSSCSLRAGVQQQAAAQQLLSTLLRKRGLHHDPRSLLRGTKAAIAEAGRA